LASWPGLSRALSRPSTRRRLKDEAETAAIGSKRLQNKALRPCGSLPVIRCAEPRGWLGHPGSRSGGRHDAFFCRRTSFPNSALPTPNSLHCKSALQKIPTARVWAADNLHQQRPAPATRFQMESCSGSVSFPRERSRRRPICRSARGPSSRRARTSSTASAIDRSRPRSRRKAA
jgi:hypothetical protein